MKIIKDRQPWRGLLASVEVLLHGGAPLPNSFQQVRTETSSLVRMQSLEELDWALLGKRPLVD